MDASRVDTFGVKHVVLAASHRADSYNRRLAGLVTRALREAGDEVDALDDYDDFCLPNYDDAARERGELPAALAPLAARLSAASSLVIAAPEYNWSLPGSLKNTLDWLSHYRPIPLAGQTALLLSATPGKRGGIVGLTHLKTVLEALGVFVHPGMFPCGNAPELLGDNGFTDATAEAKFHELIVAYRRFAIRLAR